MTFTEPRGDTAGFEPIRSAQAAPPTVHVASWDRQLGIIDSQNCGRFLRVQLVQQFPHGPLENYVGAINNTNPRPYPR